MPTKSRPSRKRKSTDAPWLIAVSMGLGHMRAAYPLRKFAYHGEIVAADDYPQIPDDDRERWRQGRSFYETVSRASRIPFIGKLIFGIFDIFQRIGAFYPKRLATSPTLQLAQTYRMIRAGWGEHLVDALSGRPAPLLSTFFTPAFMAEEFEFPGPIWCMTCDADVSRAWAPEEPARSRIRYFAPTHHVAERLMRYGVPHDHITVTGFPLPTENLGSPKFETARRDLLGRLPNLDASGDYRRDYAGLIKEHLGKIPRTANHPLTLLFAVGGAGAQADIACAAIRSLRPAILSGKLRFTVSTGTHPELIQSIRARIKDDALADRIGFITNADPIIYFESFNRALHTTDILWTKPSELSFYAGLGLPILIAPPLGSHEEWNRDWLLSLGAGIDQGDPRYTDEWLFDILNESRFAEAAMQSFIQIEKGGVFAIEDILIPKH